MDRDESAIAAARERLVRFGGKVSYYHGSYGDIEEATRESAPLAGVVADLGWSRTQIEDPERGFSFQNDGPLDMRYDRRQDLTAAHVVNHYDEREIADLLYELGGERRSRQIARAVVRGRPFLTTRQLAELVEQVVPRARPKKFGGPQIHPATRTFQALRIAVNDDWASWIGCSTPRRRCCPARPHGGREFPQSGRRTRQARLPPMGPVARV